MAGGESIEIFDVDAKAAQPALTWVGCIIAPEKVGFNAVVALPEGGVAATHARTGVWEWHATSGWKIIPGAKTPYRTASKSLATDERCTSMGGKRRKSRVSRAA